jgi:hypothetical protein
MPVRRRYRWHDLEADDVSVFQVLAMPSRKALLIYLVLFTVVSVAAGLTYRLVDWGIDVAGCKLYREPGTFLAFCQSPRYGDYEHGAYYLDLEPETIENLKKAKVLFLGNSRAQFGFSTDEVRNYFNERSIPFYIMGFAYGESSDFARILIEKFNLKPKVLVIDTDPFFNPGLSEPALAILDQSGSFLDRGLRFIRTRWDYLTKSYFNRLQPKACDLLAMLCSSQFRVIYRAEKDGSWIWRELYYSAEAGRIPNDGPKRMVMGSEDAIAYEGPARSFFETAGVRPECVALTHVPNSVHDAKPYTVEMGRRLGARVELPELPGLETVDTSHLTWSSAQRWSGTFMRGIDSLVTRSITADFVPDKAQTGTAVIKDQLRY